MDERILKCDFCPKTMPVAQLSGCDDCGAQWCDLCDTKHKNYCEDEEFVNCSVCGRTVLTNEGSIQNHECVPPSLPPPRIIG